jgi:hypothetical protein
MPRRAYSFRQGQRVRFRADGRVGITIRLNGTYAQWLIELPDGRLTWWWEDDCESADD